ncbi:B3 domain-containing protein At3g18960 [Arachis duranensis]|uniref:B3 domain-containing protein At3g18960 n=1 Tax=Arachis duranensis TaxID=130453 RepID=A0A6P4CAA0_ARADU|nr:B3 domain-containing protein At3g18960 [Arachis duranensis]
MASSISSDIRFFKIGLKKSLEDGNLKLTKKFSKEYGDSVPNPVYLKPPDGTAWKIDWSLYDGLIQFENGWKEFASYYSLDNGHLLQFAYNETSNIEVQIFDIIDGSEINYPSLDHIGDDNSIEILNELPPRGWPRKKLKAAAEVSSPSTSKILRSSVKTGDVEKGPDKQNWMQCCNNEEASQSEETGLKN